MDLARWLIRHTPTVPLKRWIWSSARRREFDFAATTRFGCTLSGNTRDFIQRYIYYFGVWEPNISAWIERSLAPGDVFIDVGANIGYYSLLAGRIVGSHGKVVAIEALPEIFDRLARHVAENHLENVRLVNEAAAAEPGEITLYFGAEQNIGSTSMVQSAETSDRTATVPARPLWAMLTAQERQRARVIKIDVEGAEATVVRGLQLDSPEYRRDLELVIEVSCERWHDEGARANEFIRFMQAFGFNVYVLRNDHHFRSYLESARPHPALRLRSKLTHMSDLVFSRTDAEFL